MIDMSFHYLRFLHGFYNFILFIMILYQGVLGLNIRRERKVGKASFTIIRRHRRLGLILIAGALMGFLAGMIVAYINNGHIFKYPIHFILGFLIVISFFINFLISKKITRNDSSWRDRHFLFGIFIVFLYIIQMILGLLVLI